MADTDCEVVKNQVLGKDFYYCRTHKTEARNSSYCEKRYDSTGVKAVEALKGLQKLYGVAPDFSKLDPVNQPASPTTPNHTITTYIAGFPILAGNWYYVDPVAGNLFSTQDTQGIPIECINNKAYFYAQKDGKFSGYTHDPTSWKVDYT